MASTLASLDKTVINMVERETMLMMVRMII